MRIIKKFEAIDKRFAWSFMGFVLAVFFGCLAIYTEFFRIKSPIINYEIIYNESIIDIKEDISKLDIIYDNINIRKAKQTLRAVIIKISNSGNESLLKIHYDENSPLGIKFENGKVIKFEITQSSDDYLMQNVKATVNDSIVTFNQIIIDENQFFIYKFLLLHSNDKAPAITQIGKIAGIPSIKIIDRINDNDTTEIWTQITEGTLLIHFVRLPLYLFGLFFLFIFTIIPLFSVFEWIDGIKRKSNIKKYKSYIKRELSRNDEKIALLYQQYSKGYLEDIIAAAIDTDKLISLIRESKLNSKDKSQTKAHDGVESYIEYFPFMLDPEGFVSSMMDIGLLKSDHTIDDEVLSKLNEFMGFIKIRGA